MCRRQFRNSYKTEASNLTFPPFVSSSIFLLRASAASLAALERSGKIVLTEKSLASLILFSAFVSTLSKRFSISIVLSFNFSFLKACV